MCRRSDGSHGLPDLFEFAATIPTAWWAIILTHGFHNNLDPGIWSRIVVMPKWFGWVITLLTAFQVLAVVSEYDQLARWTWMVSAGWWVFVTVIFASAPEISTGPGPYLAIALLSFGCYRRRGRRLVGD